MVVGALAAGSEWALEDFGSGPTSDSRCPVLVATKLPTGPARGRLIEPPAAAARPPRYADDAFSEEPAGTAGCIVRRRIEACRLTCNNRAHDHGSITEIALACGFFDMAHFSRVLRVQLGLPPSDYRRGSAAQA